MQNKNSVSETDSHYHSRICPNCNTQLRTIAVNSLDSCEIESCDSCGGLFFDTGELQSLLDKKNITPQSLTSHRQYKDRSPEHDAKDVVHFRKCPVCRTIMRNDLFQFESDIQMNVCDYHGIWLENDQLPRIISRKSDLEYKRQRSGGAHKSTVSTTTIEELGSGVLLDSIDCVGDILGCVLEEVVGQLWNS